LNHLTQNPRQTGTKEGNRKIRRKIRRPQIVEGIGSPHSTISGTGSSATRIEQSA
jgi:hypothetical protein